MTDAIPPAPDKADLDAARRRLKDAEDTYRDRVKVTREAEARARREYDQALKAANKQLQQARKSHSQGVSRAQKELESARTGQLLANYGSVRVFENRLQAPEGTVALSSAIKATAHVSGEQTKKTDTREVVLEIDTPNFDSITQCNRADGTRVREFAAKLNTAAKNADAHRNNYEKRLAEAQSQRESAEANTAPIENAAAVVAATEADTEGVDLAESARIAAEADMTELEAAREHLLALDPKAKIKTVKARSFGGTSRPAAWWKERSRIGKILWATGGAVVTLIVLITVIGTLAGTDTTDAEVDAAPAAESSKPPPKPTTTTEATAPPAPPPAPPPPATPKERVRAALGAEVQAGGYAGDLPMNDVFFEGAEVQVTTETPAGGFDGAKCGDLEDGAQAVFETIYNDGGWNGGAALVYKGGLVSTTTGEELPDVNTGIFTMPAAQAKRINWANEDALFNIDWTNYRDYCHPALE